MIDPPRSERLALSFINLVEVHVLDSIRRKFEIPLPKVRRGIAYLRKQFRSNHPLAEHRLETDGKDLFVRVFGDLISITGAGQLVMKELLEAHLQRIEWDDSGLAIRLFPFTRKRFFEEPKVVVIDPRVSFGRPVLVRTGIPTAVVAERYKAGESMDELAEDYGRDRLEIEEAVRCELALEAA